MSAREGIRREIPVQGSAVDDGSPMDRNGIQAGSRCGRYPAGVS